MKKTSLIVIAIIIIALLSCIGRHNEKDDWHNLDGTPIVCRVCGCKKTPLYSNWDDRFCVEHLDKSKNHSDMYDSSIEKKKVNTTKALTKEEADKLRGTGYHGTRPNSVAENIELDAAMNTCRNCGMHTDNGSNSLCYECQYNKEHGFN